MQVIDGHDVLMACHFGHLIATAAAEIKHLSDIIYVHTTKLTVACTV